MKSIYRQMFHHGSVMMLGLGLVGCSSESATQTPNAQNAPVTNVPAAQAPAGANNMGAPNAQPGVAGNQSNMANNTMAPMMNQHGAAPMTKPMPGGNTGGAPMNNQMANMSMQHGAGAPGLTKPQGNSATAPMNNQMADMMKQHGAGAPGQTKAGAPSTMPGAPSTMPGAPSTMPGGNKGTGPSSEQMAAMMKMNGPGSGPPATGKPPGGPSADQMAAMMKMNGPGSGPPAGANSGGVPSQEQMAAMMKMNQAGGGQPGAHDAPGTGRGGRGGAGGGGMGAGGGGNPGTMGMGRGGMGGGAGGRGKIKEGSIDDTLMKFCNAMAEGDTAAASEYIHPRAAKGILVALRDGKLAEEKIEEITKIITPYNELKRDPNQITDSRRHMYNADNQAMTFVLKKEKDVYKLVELSLPKSKKE